MRTHKPVGFWIVIHILFIAMNPLLSEEITALQKCIIQQMEQMSDDATLGEMKTY